MAMHLLFDDLRVGEGLRLEAELEPLRREKDRHEKEEKRLRELVSRLDEQVETDPGYVYQAA